MKVTGTGRSSTWFKGNIFQADSRKRVFFYAVPEKHFLLIGFLLTCHIGETDPLCRLDVDLGVALSHSEHH